MNRWRSARLGAALTAVVLLAAACAQEQPQQQPEQPVKKGGQIVIGAEQWGECINPITSCQGASWVHWAVYVHVLPKLTEVDAQGNYAASPLITEMPTLENGLITEDPFTITFNLNPDAVWDDGSPITCNDVRFTWLAQLNTKGTYAGGVGFDQIEEIDCSDEKTVVINFSAPYAPWNELFGGGGQFVLKADAYPDADPEAPDISEENAEEIPYSGGPWILQEWTTEQAVFVPNENYWVEERKPNLEQVTFIPIIDQAAEINAIQSGEVDVVFPQPSEVSIPEQLSGAPVEVRGVPGVFNEEIWINHSSPPLDEQPVREALAFALDRQAVIDAIITVNQPDAQVSTCVGPLAEHLGPWCTPQFDDVTYDPAQAISLLEGAGFDCSGVPESPCERDGEPLSLRYSTVTGNTRRETTQQLLKERARDAGFDFQVENYDAGVLFTEVGPTGDFDLADYALGIFPDPSFTGNFSCDNIPSEENDFAGAAWTHWCNEEADQAMKDSDAAIDPAQRQELLNRVQELYREDVASIPLYILPNVCAWRTDKIAGPVDQFCAHPLSMFWNMWDWHIV